MTTKQKTGVKEIGVYFSILWTLLSALVLGVWKGSDYLKNKEKQTTIIEHTVAIQTKDIDSLNKAMEKNDLEHKEISAKVSEIHSDVRIIRVLMEASKTKGGNGYAEGSVNRN